MYFRQIDEIAAGTKTQTRRVCKPNEQYDRYDQAVYIATQGGPFHWNWASKKRLKWRVGNDYAVSPGRGRPCVWVNKKGQYIVPAQSGSKLGDIDLLPITDDWLRDHYYHPLRIVITAIRREPLAAISEEDAIAEGYPYTAQHIRDSILPPIGWYRDLWESINGAGSWDRAGDVWVLTFEVKHAQSGASTQADPARD